MDLKLVCANTLLPARTPTLTGIISTVSFFPPPPAAGVEKQKNDFRTLSQVKGAISHTSYRLLIKDNKKSPPPYGILHIIYDKDDHAHNFRADL